MSTSGSSSTWTSRDGFLTPSQHSGSLSPLVGFTPAFPNLRGLPQPTREQNDNDTDFSWVQSLPDPVKQADHQALLRHGNVAYSKLLSAYNDLSIRHDTLRTAYNTLATSIPQIFKHIPNPLNFPIPASYSSASASAGASSLSLDPLSPLVQSDFPDIQFWNRSDFKEDGLTDITDNDEKSGKLAFLEHRTGTQFTAAEIKAVRKSAYGSFQTLLDSSNAPLRWSQATSTATQQVRKELITEHPELALCANNWKVDAVLTEVYGQWTSRRKDAIHESKQVPTSTSGSKKRKQREQPDAVDGTNLADNNKRRKRDLQNDTASTSDIPAPSSRAQKQKKKERNMSRAAPAPDSPRLSPAAAAPNSPRSHMESPRPSPPASTSDLPPAQSLRLSPFAPESPDHLNEADDDILHLGDPWMRTISTTLKIIWAATMNPQISSLHPLLIFLLPSPNQSDLVPNLKLSIRCNLHKGKGKAPNLTDPDATDTPASASSPITTSPTLETPVTSTMVTPATLTPVTSSALTASATSVTPPSVSALSVTPSASIGPLQQPVPNASAPKPPAPPHPQPAPKPAKKGKPHRPGVPDTAWNLFGREHMQTHPKDTNDEVKAIWAKTDQTVPEKSPKRPESIQKSSSAKPAVKPNEAKGSGGKRAFSLTDLEEPPARPKKKAKSGEPKLKCAPPKPKPKPVVKL
ncbi:hypothetical protein B0H16DRAFT_1901938 [Mycena metata]|uniref:Uncharacterized protein n=1 Tax=Mycena metata TaxID=1033252 RepID=A0AAD7GTV5_9AGAR|nr:hypothetical protein B0H16DRAFT_1901938 [Mycena metata]